MVRVSPEPHSQAPAGPSHSLRMTIPASLSLPRSKPIIHPRTHPRVRPQPLEPAAAGDVLRAIPHAVDVLVAIPRQRRRIARDRLPRHVERVVPIVEYLRIRWVRAPRLHHHGVDYE